MNSTLTIKMGLILNLPSDIWASIIERLDVSEAGRLCLTCKTLLQFEHLIIQKVIRPFYCYESALLFYAEKPIHAPLIGERDVKQSSRYGDRYGGRDTGVYRGSYRIRTSYDDVGRRINWEDLENEEDGYSEEFRLGKPCQIKGLIFLKLLSFQIDSTLIDEEQLFNNMTPTPGELKEQIQTVVKHILVYERVFGHWDILYSTLCYLFSNVGSVGNEEVLAILKAAVLRIINGFETDQKMTKDDKIQLIMDCSKQFKFSLLTECTLLNTTILDEHLSWVLEQDITSHTFREILACKKVEPRCIAKIIVSLCNDRNDKRIHVLTPEWYSEDLFEGVRQYSRYMISKIFNTVYETESRYLGSQPFQTHAFVRAIAHNFIIFTPHLFDKHLYWLVKLSTADQLSVLIMKTQYVPKDSFIAIASTLKASHISSLITIPSIKQQLDKLTSKYLNYFLSTMVYDVYPCIDFSKVPGNVINDMVMFDIKVLYHISREQRIKYSLSLSDSQRTIIIDTFLVSQTPLVLEICNQNTVKQLFSTVNSTDINRQYVRNCLKVLLPLIEDKTILDTVFKFVFKIHPFVKIPLTPDVIHKIQLELDN